MSNGKDVVKIPIRSLDEYKIRYNYDKNKHVGQGDGESQVGMLWPGMDQTKNKGLEKGRVPVIRQARIIMKRKFH